MDDIDFIDVIECVTARLETAVVEWVTEDDLGQIVEVITIVAESQVVETQLIYYEWGGGTSLGRRFRVEWYYSVVDMGC